MVKFQEIFSDRKSEIAPHEDIVKIRNRNAFRHTRTIVKITDALERSLILVFHLEFSIQ